MKITIEITTNVPREVFAQRAALGLRSVSDEGEEIIAALEEVGRLRAPRERTEVPVASVLARFNGNVAATARFLGVARSTVRARLAREAAATLAANDNARRAG